VEVKCQLDATDDFYCRTYCLLNMFRAPLCPSSGAREYYTGVCCLWYLVLWFSRCRYGVELRVMCPVCGLLLLFCLDWNPNWTTGSRHIKTIISANCCIHRLYLLIRGLDTPGKCRAWRNILRISCASSWFFFTQL
jgi:hypothetical protein